MEKYIIRTLDDGQSNVRINSHMAKNFNLFYIRETIIRFGFKSAEIKLIIDETLDYEELLVSKNVLDKLKLPLTCSYHIKILGNEIILGPFIGIFMGNQEKNLLNNLRLLDNYIKNYLEINGVIMGFTLDDINKENLTIKGYMYNPEHSIWQKTELPYPDMILKRRSLNQQWREYFTTLYKDKIFNYKPLNKWEVFERLIQFPQTARMLPPTRLFNDFKDIINYLEEYGDIYVKPISGNRGIGIYNIRKANRKFYVKTRENDKNVELKLKNKNELLSFVEQNLTSKDFIIQKTLDIKVDNKVIDFRIGLDKDQSGNWKKIMFVTRVSGERSIVSNVARSGGSVQLPKDTLKNLYKMSDSEAQEYEDRLVSDAENIANNIDSTGLQFGKLALDLSIDAHKNVWLIEVNNKNPNDALMRKLGDEQTFFNIRHTNMLYAKKLSGFNINSNSRLIEVKETLTNESKTKRFKSYFSITGKFKSIKSYIEKLGNNLNLVGIVKNNESKRIVELEIEGKGTQLIDFLNEIKNSEYHSRIKGIAISEIPMLQTEKHLRREKGSKD